MAFVPGYEHDIFVSYAHTDDEAMVDTEYGWVTTHVGALKKKLNKKLGRVDAYQLWMDHDMSYHSSVTDQLMETVQGTATLVVVLSPAYLASEWCLREKDAFMREIGQRRVRSGSRLFVVELDNLEAGDRPEAFRDLKGYKFWEKEPHGDQKRILCEASLTTADPDYLEYFRRLDKLASDLAKELKALKAAEGGAASESDGGPYVYLAEPTDDQVQLRDEVTAYLDQFDVDVLPQRYYDREPEAYRQAMERDMARCKFFVQLLGPYGGTRLHDLPHGCARLQYEIARESGKEILQWRDPDLDLPSVADPDQRKLLELETVNAEGICDFRAEVKKRALESSEPKPASLSAFVFVDSEANDRELAQSIREELVGHGLDVSLPVWQGDARAVREDLEDNLRLCDGLIVVYGQATDIWVRKQLLQCRKALAERDQPLLALAVYQGPPEEKAPLNIDMKNLQVIDCRKEPSEGIRRELQAFISAIE